jgi:hypothetical protein
MLPSFCFVGSPGGHDSYRVTQRGEERGSAPSFGQPATDAGEGMLSAEASARHSAHAIRTCISLPLS